MATPSAEEFKKLRKRVRKLEKTLDDRFGELWEALAATGDIRAKEEDEIRDIADRARRSIARHIKDDH